MNRNRFYCSFLYPLQSVGIEPSSEIVVKANDGESVRERLGDFSDFADELLAIADVQTPPFAGRARPLYPNLVAYLPVIHLPSLPRFDELRRELRNDCIAVTAHVISWPPSRLEQSIRRPAIPPRFRSSGTERHHSSLCRLRQTLSSRLASP